MKLHEISAAGDTQIKIDSKVNTQTTFSPIDGLSIKARLLCRIFC